MIKKFKCIFILLLFYGNPATAYDEAQLKERKAYEQRIYSQKELIQKLDIEVSTIQNKLQDEILQSQRLNAQVNEQQKVITMLKEQLNQAAIAQQILQANHQTELRHLQQQSIACQQNQQQCLYQIQTLSQQLQSLTSVCRK